MAHGSPAQSALLGSPTEGAVSSGEQTLHERAPAHGDTLFFQVFYVVLVLLYVLNL